MTAVPLFRLSDPETSYQAATSFDPRRLEDAVLWQFTMAPGGLTDDELAACIDAHPPTVKTLRSRLTKAGRLEDSGLRRPSDRGRLMVVWRASRGSVLQETEKR